MYTKEQIEETCKNMPWLAYQQGLQDGYNSAFHDLRNQAAIAAMQGMLSNSFDHELMTPDNVAKQSVKYADALVKELKGKEK